MDKQLIELEPLNCLYGAPMGRDDRIVNVVGCDGELVVHLADVPLIDGGYDIGGAYWGATDTPLWVAECGPWFDPQQEDDVYFRVFERASSREQAEQRVQERFSVPLVFHYAHTNTWHELALEKDAELVEQDGGYGWRCRFEGIESPSGFDTPSEAYWSLHNYREENGWEEDSE